MMPTHIYLIGLLVGLLYITIATILAALAVQYGIVEKHDVWPLESIWPLILLAVIAIILFPAIHYQFKRAKHAIYRLFGAKQ